VLALVTDGGLMKKIVLVFLMLSLLVVPSMAMTIEEELVKAKLDLFASQMNQLKLQADAEKLQAELDMKRVELEQLKASPGIDSYGSFAVVEPETNVNWSNPEALQ
jgi:hypothetical protein